MAVDAVVVRWKTCLLDASLLALACLACYLWLGSDTFYKADGHHLVLRLIHGDSHYPHHKLYMPLLIEFGRLTAGLGLSPYRTAVVFSSLGVAAGVFFVRLGFGQWTASRVEALAGTLLVAFCPAVFLFATVVEFHGPFFGFAALAFFEVALLVRRPTLLGAVFSGVFSAIAAGVHGSGLVLPALFLPWFLALRKPARTPLPDLLRCIVAAAVHVVLIRVLAAPDKAGEFMQAGFQHPQGIEHLPGIVWNEWIAAFPLVSVLAFVAFARRGLRLAALALTIGLVPYLYAALRLLVGDPEWGAYLLPAAIPAAWLALRSLPRRVAFVAVVAGAVIGVLQQRAIDRSADYERYAAGVRAAIDPDHALLLLGDPAELGPCLVEVPEVEVYLLDEVTKFKAAEVAALLPLFDATMREHGRAGRAVYLTAGGRRFLETTVPGVQESGPVLLAHIEQRYDLAPVGDARFRAWRLTPR